MKSRNLALPAVLIAIGAGIAALSRLETGTEAEALGGRGSATAAAQAEHTGSDSASHRTSSELADAKAGQGRAGAEQQGIEVKCLRASDGAPLAGVRVYEQRAATLGPSGPDGVLRFAESGWGRRTLWAEGYVAQRLDGPVEATELRFEAAEGEIVLSLLQATPQHRTVRTLVQRHGSESPPRGPWSPRLEVISWDRLTAIHVPRGTYDVYVWIAQGEGAPHPYSIREVEIEAGQRKALTLDLVADLEDAHETDS